MIQTAGLVEVVIHVQDMDRMVRFYRDALGLSVLHPKNVNHYKHEHSVTLDTGACLLVLRATKDKNIKSANPRIVFGVRDIEQARCFLLQRQVQIGEIRMEDWSTLVCDCYDPEGNLFSLECQGQPSTANAQLARA